MAEQRGPATFEESVAAGRRLESKARAQKTVRPTHSAPRASLPSTPKQGIKLGEMPLTLFLLVAAAVLYIHFRGLKLPSGPGRVFGGEGETPTHEMTGPVQVVPQQSGPPVLPPPPWKVIVPSPGSAK